MTKARNWKKAAWITFFVLPGAAIVFIFILLPLFMSLFNSFFSWNQLIRGEFIGLENFQKLFSGYPYQERFTNALGNNVKWFVVTMLVQNTLGILLAMCSAAASPGTVHTAASSLFPYCFPSLRWAFSGACTSSPREWSTACCPLWAVRT